MVEGVGEARGGGVGGGRIQRLKHRSVTTADVMIITITKISEAPTSRQT